MHAPASDACRSSRLWRRAPPRGRSGPRTRFRARVVIPKWARNPAPAEARPPRPLAPSAIAIDDESAPPPSEAMRAAAMRGTWIHQLLERLAGGGADARPGAADRWLERSAGVATAATSGTRSSIRSAGSSRTPLRRFVRPELAGRSAARRDPARRPSHRRNRRSAAGRGGRVSVIDFKTGRVPDERADSSGASRADARLCERCGSSSRAATSARRSSTPPGRN